MSRLDVDRPVTTYPPRDRGFYRPSVTGLGYEQQQPYDQRTVDAFWDETSVGNVSAAGGRAANALVEKSGKGRKIAFGVAGAGLVVAALIAIPFII